MGLEGFAGRRAREVTVVGQGQGQGSSLRPDCRGGGGEGSCQREAGAVVGKARNQGTPQLCH